MSYNRRTWQMLLTITTSVVEHSYLHSMFAQHKQGDSRAWFRFNSGLLELNLQLYLDEVCLDFHDSIHAPFSAVHLKWSKDCIIKQARRTCSCEFAGSSLVVALKLRNIKVGCPAHVRCNYNFLILLCSSTKIKCHCGDRRLHLAKANKMLHEITSRTWRRFWKLQSPFCAVPPKLRDVAHVTF